MERPTLALPEMAQVEGEPMQKQNVIKQPQSQMDMNLIASLSGAILIDQECLESLVQLIIL